MQQNKRSPRYGLDGFVPRDPRQRSRRRASIDDMPEKARHSRRAKPEAPRHQSSHQPLTWDETAKNGSLSQPIDIDNLPEQTKPRWWQRRKKKALQAAQPQSRRRKITKRTIFVIVLLIGLVGAFLGWRFLQTASKVFDGNVLGFLDTTKLKGEDQGRVTILLAGTSEDDGPKHGGAALTDSIMLVSVDTKNNKAFTTSIPRDLWVKYGQACNSGYEGKINEVYNCGNESNFKESGYPDGGMGMLSKVVSENFGIPIHYYGKINYTAFKEAVNAVGGITITIDSDDPRGIYDYNQGSLKLSNGPHQLDGDTALRLARARASSGGYGLGRGDFDRTKYQREMLIALKSKVTSANILANPAKISSLLEVAGDNVNTNFKTNELRRLYDISKKVTGKNISSIDLVAEDVNLVTTGSYNGASIVMPTAGLRDFSAIKAYFKKLTSTDPVVREDASIVVLNASGVVGAAQKQADEITAKGLNVGAVANAGVERPSTVIVDLSKGSKNNTKKLLENLLGATATTNSSSYPEAAKYQADFVVILGKQASSSGTN